MYVCWQTTGNPLAFVEIQDAWRADNKIINPLRVMLNGLSQIVRIHSGDAIYIVSRYGKAFGSLMAIVTATIVIYGRRRLGWALTLWSLTTIVMYLCTGLIALFSLPRYMVVIFPQYMVLASHGFNRFSFSMVVAVLMAIQAISMALWTNGFAWAL